MKQFQWTVTDKSGLDHAVTLERSIWSNKLAVTVDGVKTVVKPRSRQIMSGIIDHTLPVGAKTCHLVVLGQQADLATDGQYLSSKRPYLPYQKRPKWVWFFWILCLAICAMGGALPWIIALASAAQCSRISISPYLEKKQKIRGCIITTAAAWVVLAITVLLAALLFA